MQPATRSPFFASLLLLWASCALSWPRSSRPWSACQALPSSSSPTTLLLRSRKGSNRALEALSQREAIYPLAFPRSALLRRSGASAPCLDAIRSGRYARPRASLRHSPQCFPRCPTVPMRTRLRPGRSRPGPSSFFFWGPRWLSVPTSSATRASFPTASPPRRVSGRGSRLRRVVVFGADVHVVPAFPGLSQHAIA